MTKELKQFNKQQEENNNQTNVDRILTALGNNKRDIYIAIGLIASYVVYNNIEIQIPSIYFAVLQVGLISLFVVYALKDWIYKFIPQPTLNLILKIHMPEAESIEDIKNNPKIELGILMLSDHMLDEYTFKGEINNMKNIYVVEDFDTDEKILKGSWLSLVSSYVLLSKKSAVEEIRNELSKEVFTLKAENQGNELQNVQDQFDYGSDIAEVILNNMEITESELQEMLNTELEDEDSELFENAEENLSVEDVIDK